MMKQLDKNGQAKIVKKCTYPLTARKVVDYIVTEFTVMAITSKGLTVMEMADDITEEILATITEANFTLDLSTAGI